MHRRATCRASVSAVRAFINGSWQGTFRYHPDTEGDLIGLPHRYTVPTVDGVFQEMYYWDTYFTNEGLILDGHLDQAINNTENIAYLVDLYGRMPNGNRTWFENRSQPPYLAMMVDRLYHETGDRQWLRRLAPSVEREHRFWTTRRLTPCGLSRYSHEGTLADKLDMVETLRERLGPRFRDRAAQLSPAELAEVGAHHLAEAESGWDFTPRFAARCEDHCPVDLNANLLLYETTLARFADELGRPAAARDWLAAARRRKALLRRYCHDPRTGLYHDYDFVRQRRSVVCSAAVFSLLYAGAISRADAARLVPIALRRLEHPYGLAACARGAYDHAYQWSYPNSWAPLTLLACAGLARYGHDDAASRIAAKYLDAVSHNFAVTGNLWEKYNAVDGSILVGNEYEMPPMMGWTAGVFVWASELLARAGERYE